MWNSRETDNSRSRAINWLDLFSSFQSKSVDTGIDPNAMDSGYGEMGVGDEAQIWKLKIGIDPDLSIYVSLLSH